MPPKRLIRNNRAKQILLLLKTHGPISFRVLKVLIEPTIAERKLFEALKRLKAKGFIIHREEKTIGQRFRIYQINQAKWKLEEVAKFLNCSADKLKQPFFRYREILHNDSCALMHSELLKLFPDAELTRDFEFQRSQYFEESFISFSDDRGLKPDLLLNYTLNDDAEPTSIAFEFEKTQKSAERIADKMVKYSAKSKVDGVVYIADKHTIIEAIRRGFKQHALRQSLRVSHYGENFILFAEAGGQQQDWFKSVYNLTGQAACIKQWLHTLRTTSRNLRRNQQFAIPADHRRYAETKF